MLTEKNYTEHKKRGFFSSITSPLRKGGEGDSVEHLTREFKESYLVIIVLIVILSEGIITGFCNEMVSFKEIVSSLIDTDTVTFFLLKKKSKKRTQKQALFIVR